MLRGTVSIVLVFALVILYIISFFINTPNRNIDIKETPRSQQTEQKSPNQNQPLRQTTIITDIRKKQHTPTDIETHDNKFEKAEIPEKIKGFNRFENVFSQSMLKQNYDPKTISTILERIEYNTLMDHLGLEYIRLAISEEIGPKVSNEEVEKIKDIIVESMTDPDASPDVSVDFTDPENPIVTNLKDNSNHN